VSQNKGWISLHRNIRDHWLYKENRKFSRFEAWVDLLLEANHKDNKFPLGNEIVECKRGQLITSIRKLCDRWNWSNTKVTNFLKLLQDDEMITYFSDTKKTVITIVNYSLYQDMNDTKTYQKRHKDDIKTTREHTNNNDNNVNNDNKSVCIYDENLKNIVKLLEDNIGIIPPILIDEINEYSKTFDIKMFSEAIKIAARNKKRNINYVLGILRNWRDNNILTIDDLEAFRREKEIERKEKQQQYKNKKQYRKPKTRFHNFEQRTDSYTEDDIEAIAERKRQEYIEKIKKNKKSNVL